MKLADTPITQHTFNGHPFYLKRDDLLHPQFSGNKARKFMALLEGDFPEITTLISYGSPQANSLYSLAALAQLKGWKLEFYVDHIPNWLQNNPIGNYQAALELGAKVIATHQTDNLHPRDYIQTIRQPDKQCLVVDEGGRDPMAEWGIQQLASEILHWRQQTLPQEALTLALPSGTGTTALYLHKHLHQHDIQVITCACVGDEHYLIEQFKQLGEKPLLGEKQRLDEEPYPSIIHHSTRQKHQFGKLYQADFQLWQDLQQQTDVEFDLLYDPYMWLCLSEWRQQHPESKLLYLHQGGLLGNLSMKARYQRKYS